MAKVKFEDIEKDLLKTKEQATKVAENRGKIEDGLTKVLSGAPLTGMTVDLDDADFEAVRKNEKAFEANIATLIFGLDEVTKTFGAEFKTMSELTAGEKIMGIFSRKKSAEMRSSRVRSTDIRGNLTQLIAKSNVIQGILAEQLAVLEDRLSKTAEGQVKVLDRGRETAVRIEGLTKDLDALAPRIEALDLKLSEATGEDRKKVEKERAELVNAYNEANTQLQSATAEQQSLERYASQYSNYVESLTRQKAAQQTLINKLKIDTEQRTVLYDTLAESLRTSQQQDIAHKIDEVGRETDAQAEELMLQAGVSASNKIVGMMEAHREYMRRTEEVARKGKIAEETFQRRFGEIMKGVDSGRYTGTEA